MLNWKPLCIELFAGCSTWAAGWRDKGGISISFDICHEDYHGEVPERCALCLYDVLDMHGSMFRDADLILCSPPCQEYSYMAMPWPRGKQIRKALNGEGEFPESYTGSRTIPELTALFDACFRIQREASEAAGRRIPMVVENVRGAQQWVGHSKWNHGSFHIWGDVPALMPIKATLREAQKRDGSGGKNAGVKGSGGSWYGDYQAQKAAQDEAIKQGGDWLGKSATGSISRRYSSRSKARKAESAHIARIPYALSRHIAEVYWPI